MSVERDNGDGQFQDMHEQMMHGESYSLIPRLGETIYVSGVSINKTKEICIGGKAHVKAILKIDHPQYGRIHKIRTRELPAQSFSWELYLEPRQLEFAEEYGDQWATPKE